MLPNPSAFVLNTVTIQDDRLNALSDSDWRSIKTLFCVLLHERGLSVQITRAAVLDEPVLKVELSDQAGFLAALRKWQEENADVRTT